MSALDFLVIGLFAAAVLAVGARSGPRGGEAGQDWVLAGRSLPSWAVLGSMVATELSAATFIGVPHAAYTGTWAYAQLALGALVAKGLLAWRVIPLYHRLGVVTVYGFLESRFGPATRRSAALCFVAGRVLASGARLFIAALALAVATGVPVEIAIVACGVLAGVYTGFGGIRAVVWTDTLQAAVFVLAAGAIAIALAGAAPGGIGEITGWAAAEGRMRVIQLEPLFSLGSAQAFGAAVAGGFFLTLATHATDHDMVQRLLTTRDARGARQALLGSALLNFPFTVLFLSLGTGLAFFYAHHPDRAAGDSAHVLPLFVVHELPAGLRGLFFAGLLAAAMSSLDSALCAISTTWVVDVRRRAEAPSVARLRRSSAGFCLLLVAAALAMAAYHRALATSSGGGAPSLVELALSAMTILYGGLLGIFALGIASARRGNDRSAPWGLAAGGLVGVALFLHPVVVGRPVIAWPWWVPIGAVTALAVVALPGGRPSESG